MDELVIKLKEIEDKLSYLRNDSPLSVDDKQKQIDYLEKEKREVESSIKTFSDINVKIDALEKKESLNKEEKKELKSLKESLERSRKEYNKKYQGRYRDLLSAHIGQIDKRIYNMIYKNNSLWRNKKKRVSERYDKTLKYLLKNIGISLGVVLIPGLVSLVVPAVAPYAIVSGAIYFGQTIIKTIATYRNKRLYGGPRLVRSYDISKDGYFNNTGNSWNNIINGNLLSKSDVRKITNVKSEKNVDDKKNNNPSIKDSSKDDNKFLTLVSSIILSANIDELSNDELTKIVKLVTDNDLEDKLSNDIKNKYLVIKEKLKNKDKTSDILLNSINNELEKLDISTIDLKKKEHYVKIIEDNNLQEKLSDKAKENYKLLLSFGKKNDDIDEKIDYINNLLANFKYKAASFDDYDNLFKYISDNDLEKKVSHNVKLELNNLRLVYHTMMSIRDFDMNNFDSNKAILIIDAVKSNKLISKLNSAMYSKYQFIQKKLNLLFDRKKDDLNNKDNREKLIDLKNMIAKINLSNLSVDELSSLIDYIEKNDLSIELSDVLNKLQKIYSIKSKNQPKMEDYGNKRIGISGDNQESLAKYFINHPPKITKDMSYDMKNISILAKKIKDGTATSSEVNKYAILIYNLTGQEWFQEEMEYYLDSEYEKYRKDMDKYEGKKAK